MSEQSREITFPAPTLAHCPKCAQISNMVLGPITIPVKIRIFFIITLTTAVTLEYCPKCGRLKINVLT